MSYDDEIPGDAPKSGKVSAWLSEIDRAYDAEGMARYNDRCKKIRERYRYEGSAFVKSRHYQLLWANIETMKSAIYARPPKCTVSRRYRDPDQIGRVAAEVLERAINFSFDASDFDSAFKQVRDDFLLYGRGCARIYYEPEYETEDDLNEDIEDAEDIKGQSAAANVLRAGAGSSGTANPPDAGGKPEVSSGSSRRGEPEQALAFENVRVRFVQRSDFRHQGARTWDEVQWVAFRAFMTRAEITERFDKEIGDNISLDSNPADVDENEGRMSASGHVGGAKATVWEIWDKAKNEVLWIAKSWPEVLEEGEPYLVLDGFYPCPRPAYGTLTPDSLVPVPDYVFYQDQCEEIDQLTARIGALSDALKLVGFYPGGPQGDGSPEIEKAFSAGFENKLIAVAAWSTFLEGGQGKGAPIVWLPIDMVVNIIKECIELRQQLVEDVYAIMGISDIMRGATDPQETEGAQQLKAQYGGTRLRDRQMEIARFCRDIGRLVGQVICSYCSPQTIEKMTNIKLPTRQELAIAQLMAAQKAMMQPPMMAPPGGMPQPPGQPMPRPPMQPMPGRPPAGMMPGALPPQGIPRPLTPIQGGLR